MSAADIPRLYPFLRRVNPLRIRVGELWLVTCPPQYSPSNVFPTKTDKKKRKKVLLPPLFQPAAAAEWRAGLVAMDPGCLPPTFLRICPSCPPPPPPPPRPGIHALCPLFIVSVRMRSLDEYSRDEGCWLGCEYVASSAQLLTRIVTLMKTSTQEYTGGCTKMSFTFVSQAAVHEESEFPHVT